MRFPSPQKELMPGARNAVETCLGVRPGEHVALIADEASRAVAASIAAALDERRARYTGLLLEELGPRPMKAAPASVLDELETADVGVLCMTPQPGELAEASCTDHAAGHARGLPPGRSTDRKSTRLNSSHTVISYAVFCLK